MRRIINARIPVLIACSLALGVLLGYIFSYCETNIVWLIAVIPFNAIIFLLCLNFKKRKLAAIILVLCVVFTGGALNSYYRLQHYRICDVETETVYLVSGTVKDKGVTEYGEYIIIDNATAYDEKLSGKVRVYLPEVYGDYCDVGYYVQFYTALKFNDIFPYGELNYYAEDNVKYTCTAYSELTSTYRYSFTGNIRSLIRNTLYENLSYDTASVCYGMMLGDTQNVDAEALENFRYGGIAHIFAVSGLHIGLIYFSLTFLLRKLRVNKYVSAGLRITAIILYAGICGFSVSSIRAVVMCAVSLLAKLFNVKSDVMNNLGFATVLILFISPLSLFSVGFQLSVCAIGGICLLSNGIKRKLKRIKIPHKISSGVSASLGAQAGSLPVLLAKFGYISGAGLLLNIIVIPLVSVLFTVLFAGTFLSVIIPPAAHFIMQNTAMPLEALLSFLISANFEKTLITGFGAGIFIPVYFAVFVAFSDKLNIKLISRSVFACCGIALLIVTVLVHMHLPTTGYKVTVSAYNNGGSVLLKSPQGTVLILTENASISRVRSNLNNAYCFSLDGVIILGGSDCVETYDLSLNCNDVYVCSLNIPVQPYTYVSVHYEKDFCLCGIEFEYLDEHSLTAGIDGVNLLMSDAEHLPFISCDMLISLHENYHEELCISPCKTEYVVYFNIPKTEYNAYDDGDLIFYIKDGSIDI